ncbi:Ig-like domain-containing protein [Rhodocaloribacter sp.]
MQNRPGIFLTLLLIATAGWGPGASAQSWTFRTPMPTPRWGVASVVLGGKVYVMGGQAENGAVLDVVERYDPATDTWESVARMDDERFNAAAVVFGGKIYVLGGRDKDGDVKDDVQVYDPATGLWTPAAELEEKREGASATLLNGTIYVVGGSDENAMILNDVERLDTTSGLWSEVDNWVLDVPRASHATVTLGGIAYTVGGFSTSGPRGPVQRYDPGGIGTLGASLDPPRGGLAAAALGGEIYALGGRSAANQVVSTVNVYDPNADAWRTTAPLNTAREGFAAASVGGFLYVFGGRDDAGNVLASVEMLGGNSAPAAADDAAATNEDAAVTINVLVNDTDPDGDALTIISFTQPAHGVVTQAGDESLQYTPEPDFFGEDTFLYTVSDGTNTATAAVTVTVAAVNDAPVFTSTPVTGAVQGLAYTYAVTADDADGDALTITAPTLPAWLSLSDHGDGTASLDGTPDGADVGDHPVVLRLSDGIVSVDQSFTVTVAATNAAPAAADDAVVTDEDAAVEIDALANDSDPDGDALTITAVTSPANGTAEILAGGTRLRYTPEPDFFGEDGFTYTIVDGFGATAQAAVTVTVAPVNDAPAPPVLTTPEDGAALLIEGNPDDPLLIAWEPAEDPEGDEVVYAWELAASSGFDEVLHREDVGTVTQVEIDFGVVAALLTAQGVALNETVTFFHRIVASDGSAETPGAAFSVTLTRGAIVGVASEEEPSRLLALAQNYPNPFAETTRIVFEVPAGERGAVHLSVFDIQGRRVATLMHRPLPPGRHEVTWNGRADDGRPLASGLYLYRIEHGARQIVKTMTLIR